MLKHYKNGEIRRIPNKECDDVINKSLFGGNTQVFSKYMKADKGKSILISLDANNLYGKAMKMMLPDGKMTVSELLQMQLLLSDRSVEEQTRFS